jgi:ribonuclease P protein component
VSAIAPKGDSNPSRGDRQPGGKFPRNVRLLRHADFERVYQQGRRQFFPHMTVFYRPREFGQDLRVGFTVGKVLGGAVERNRIKRRVREAVRQRRRANVAVDVVINPKKSVLTVKFAELLVEVGRAFDVIQQNLGEKGQKSSGEP